MSDASSSSSAVLSQHADGLRGKSITPQSSPFAEPVFTLTFLRKCIEKKKFNFLMKGHFTELQRKLI